MWRLLLLREDTLESNEDDDEREGEDVHENVPEPLKEALLLAFGGHLRVNIMN